MMGISHVLNVSKEKASHPTALWLQSSGEMVDECEESVQAQ